MIINLNTFLRLENHIRSQLSKAPKLYSMLGSIGVIRFWRGLWHTADYLESERWFGSILFSGPASLLVGLIILLVSGLFVSVFIGESMVLGRLKQEQKVTTETELELEKEKIDLKSIQREIKHIEDDLHQIHPH